MSESVQANEPITIEETDVVFSCPYCEKSLAIDRHAIGMMITCPDCREEVIVPTAGGEADESKGVQLSPDQRIESLSNALHASHDDIRRLSSHLSEVSKRRKVLEHLRANNIRRMERVAEELTVIQSSVDRIATILQDSASTDDIPL